MVLSLQNRIWKHFKCFPYPSLSHFTKKRNQKEFGKCIIYLVWTGHVSAHQGKDNYNRGESNVVKALSHRILYYSSSRTGPPATSYSRWDPAKCFSLYPRVLYCHCYWSPWISKHWAKLHNDFYTVSWAVLNWEVINTFNHFWPNRIRNWPPCERGARAPALPLRQTSQ